MARTIELSGPSQQDFLRALIASEEGAGEALAERITRAMGRHIRRMHVLKASHRRLRQLPRRIVADRIADQHDPEAAAPAANPDRVPTPVATIAASQPSHASATAAFDPYAFAVEALLIKQGRDALATRLAAIGTSDDLRALAKAQRINLDAGVAGDPTASPEALRSAIVAGAERRIADRRAAAG